MNPSSERRCAPAARVRGEIRVPGDKSISHRAVLLGAIGEGEMPIAGLSTARDVGASVEALERLGVAVTKSQVQVEGVSRTDSRLDIQIVVNGSGWDGLRSPSNGPIDAQNSGTTLRLLLGILSGSSIEAVLTGDDSLRARPMLRVVKPLRAMGADIRGEAGGDRAPLEVRGAPLHGIDHRIPVASAQVKSALLIAGLRASGTTSVEEPAASRDHTERMLRYLKVPIEKSGNRYQVKSTKILNDEVTVPGDFSSAAFFFCAAAILEGGEVRVPDVGLNPTRTAFLDILGRYGARVEVADVREESGEPRGTVTVRSGDRRPVQVGAREVPGAIDELPLVGVLGAFSDGETVVTGAEELRVKESDRILALADGLRGMGVAVEVSSDGFVVRGGAPPAGGSVHSHGDHRIAMALAVAALGATGPTRIAGWDAAGVSYPGFGEALDGIVEQ